ncbi:MAG TPA: APC family permease [Bryobacteraceae bacterium]|jgi:amino acid transporter|nr:APC family permease [Bryobacteraceae bacterium]
MAILDFLFGSPLPTSDERAERIGPMAGIPIFGLDALSSAGYGPEAALTLLIPLGAAGLSYILPISISIIVLLTIVFFSYRQTIETYPGGGGSYTVARHNLGVFPGLLAAAALMIDYILVVAVGISAGVGALVSAAPGLLPHTLLLCLGILAVVTLVNLRGVRETGVVFLVPTYLFVGTLLIAIGIGLAKTLAAGGHPVPLVAPPPAPRAIAAVSVWLLLKAFASGCTAMTGVEAVSNGVKAFREPTARNARLTLAVIIGLLIVMLAGIAYLVRAYGIVATDPGASGYQSVLSMLVAAVAGKGLFYYVTSGSILLILALSANTAFADFPRLCKIIAHDGFLPRSFGARGRRLVYSQGVYVLAALAGVLLIVFGGVTDRLIPLFAVGAFMAFTLSQTGMVFHWRRTGGRGARAAMLVNGLGATATAITVLVVLVAKFIAGAWITVLLVPSLMAVMIAVRRQYHEVGMSVLSQSPLELHGFQPPLVVLPLERWSNIAKRALTFALTISPDVTAVHIDSGEHTIYLQQEWCGFVEQPVLQLGMAPPKLAILPSPYRFVITPIVDYVLDLAQKNPDRQIAVIIPEIVERRWYYHMLHNQRGTALKSMLYFKGNGRIIVVNMPWYIEAH